jgi:hypothetical protein
VTEQVPVLVLLASRAVSRLLRRVVNVLRVLGELGEFRVLGEIRELGMLGMVSVFSLVRHLPRAVFGVASLGDLVGRASWRFWVVHRLIVASGPFRAAGSHSKVSAIGR